MSHYSLGAPRVLFSHLYRILSNLYLSRLPEAPGIYFLLTDGHLYVGKSHDLKRRVPESQCQRRNWGAVYFLPMGSTCHDLGLNERKALLSQVEASCISAAHTIILGHQLPLLLGNKQHAKILPSSVLEARHLVWPPKQKREVSLGINVIKTIFKDTGLAARYCKLPSRTMLASVRAMEFTEMAQADTLYFEKPFRPAFVLPEQKYFRLKAFSPPTHEWCKGPALHGGAAGGSDDGRGLPQARDQ